MITIIFKNEVGYRANGEEVSVTANRLTVQEATKFDTKKSLARPRQPLDILPSTLTVTGQKINYTIPNVTFGEFANLLTQAQGSKSAVVIDLRPVQEARVKAAATAEH